MDPDFLLKLDALREAGNPFRNYFARNPDDVRGQMLLADQERELESDRLAFQNQLTRERRALVGEAEQNKASDRVVGILCQHFTE